VADFLLLMFTNIPKKLKEKSRIKRRNKITKPFQKITKPRHFTKPLLCAVLI